MSAALDIRRFLTQAVLTACTAAFSAAGAQQPLPARSKPLPHKDPQLATILSVVVPGGGQLYSERYGKAAIIFAGTAAGIGIAVDAAQNRCNSGGSCHVNRSVETVGIVAAAVVWGYGWATAGRDARLHNNQMLNQSSFTPFLDRWDGRYVAGLTLKTR